MNKRNIFIILLFVFMSGYSIMYIQTQHGKANSVLEVGMKAPDFSLYTTDETKYQLSSLKGKIVVLNFWTTWCPPCKEELQEIEEFFKEVKSDKDILVLGLNLTAEEESKNTVKQFVKTHRLSYPILLDTYNEVRNRYNIMVIPTTFIVDKKGRIVQKIVGPITKEQLLKATNLDNQ